MTFCMTLDVLALAKVLRAERRARGSRVRSSTFHVERELVGRSSRVGPCGIGQGYF
jgi:hypothetical protein